MNRLIKSVVSLIPDKLFLSLLFRRRMGYWINWNNPLTYNEKLQWLKIYDRHKEYTRMVDKVTAKDYVASIIGEEYIIPTFAIYSNVSEIDFEKLPDKFVLKCTHDSGGVVVCKDKKKLDKDKSLHILEKSLKESFYIQSREYPYKDVPHRIIAEKYMEDESGELIDYKFFCFNGQPVYMFVATDRMRKDTDTKFDFFDMNWRHLPFTNGHPNNPTLPQKPKNFDQMKKLAEKLSVGFPHIRVDFYNVNGKIYFGELTFFHWSGLVPFDPPKWDYKFGEFIKLPRKN